MDTIVPSAREKCSNEKTRKQIKDTVLAEGIELIFKTVTFLIIQWPKTSSSVSTEHKHSKQNGLKIFSYLIHIMLFLGAMRIWCIFMDEDVRTQQNIIVAFVLSFYTSFTGVTILHRLFGLNKFIKLRDRLLDIELYDEDESKPIRLNEAIKRLIIIQLISGALIGIVFWSILIVLPKKNSPIRIYMSYPITVESDAYLIATVFFIILNAICDVWNSCIASISIWLVLFIRQEFDCLSDYFRRNFPRANVTPKKNLSPSERNALINELYEAYGNLCGILESMNSYFQNYFGFIFLDFIVELCLFTYGLIHNLLEEFDIGLLSALSIMKCCAALYTLKETLKLKSSAHQLTDDLYGIDLRNLSSEASLKVSIFLTRLTSSPIGISVAGLFVIDHSTILMLTGTLLTYIIVVIQTKSPECRCDLQNIANITMSGT